jgi:hypothetical protein
MNGDIPIRFPYVGMEGSDGTAWVDDVDDNLRGIGVLVE